MGYYLLQLNYTSQGWAALVKNPQNRLQALAPVVQRLEGDIVNGWMQFGDYDVLVVCQLPEHVSAVERVKTTPLITFEEGIESLRKAAGTQYTPPESEFAYFGT